jgi:hypothetical protein
MIDVVIGQAEPFATEVLLAALERSFTRTQIKTWEGRPHLVGSRIVVALGLHATEGEWIAPLLRSRSKILLLGRISPAVAALAGIRLSAVSTRVASSMDAAPASPHAMSASDAAIVYSSRGLGASSPIRRRHFCRFDFRNEWNNLGYGRTTLGDDAWSVAAVAEPRGASTVAEIVLPENRTQGAVATLFDLPMASVLWHARTVGPVDGSDWHVVEAFISDYRCTDLPCRPHLRDVPDGVAAAVTMRLDCDEEISTGRGLLDLYRSRGFPISLAVRTGMTECQAHADMLTDVINQGGSILSHSVTHPSNWGGTSHAAEVEARDSKSWLEARFPGLAVRYAVSPFHQNPPFVPPALARAGYQGFVGGSIANDPEYLMARGGAVPFGPEGFISHSQTCMLHGDCVLTEPNPFRVYWEAFRTARADGRFFGYLDHPFSQRYAYGWTSEQNRVAMHSNFLDFMLTDCAAAKGPLLFVNENTCLDFMREKAATEIVFEPDRNSFEVSRLCAAGLPLSVGYRGQRRAAADA